MAEEISATQELLQSLDRMAPEFKKMLPDHIPIERFLRVARTAVAMNPALAEADRRLLWGEFMKCAQDGLLPDGHEAVINCYSRKDGSASTPKYIPCTVGILKKVRNSGELGAIDAQEVYEKDEYESWIDEKGQHFRHKKARGDRGAPLLTYAYALMKDGSVYFEEVDEDQMRSIEKHSTAGPKGPWGGSFRGEMKRKSALRRLSKRLPSSADILDVLRRDDDMYEFPEREKDSPPRDPGTPSRAAAIVTGASPPPAGSTSGEKVPSGTAGAEDSPSDRGEGDSPI